MKYIFSKEKCIEKEGIKDYKSRIKWVDEIDGKEAIFFGNQTFGFCDIYHVSKEWCEVVEE